MTTEKKPRKKKSDTSINYLIHVFNDKSLMKHIRSVSTNSCKTKKDVVKLMKEEAYRDIVKGRYYFYQVQQQVMKTLEVYPSPK